MRKQEEGHNALSAYETQNKILRQLFQQRMKARKQREVVSEEIIEEEIMFKKIKKESQASVEKAVHKNGAKQQQFLSNYPLLLNSVYFDMREKKPAFFVKMFAFFNDDVRRPTCLISKDVECIVISTYGFETETFQKLLAETSAQVYLINDSNEQEKSRVIKEYDGYKNFTVILKAKMQGLKYGVFHTKLWLIKFSKFLRVVICTSNQHLLDWGVWLNSFWYQDFPLKTSQTLQNTDKKSGHFNFNEDFANTLSEVMTSMEPHQGFFHEIGIKIEDYLFSNVEVIMIASIPGRYTKDEIKKQGMGKLREVMLSINNMKKPIVTYNSTSLGIVEKSFVNELYSHFCPNSGQFSPQLFRLIYPTQKYIQEETGGQAGVLFLTKQNYMKSNLAKQIFHRFDTNDRNPILGCIPHLKMVIIQQQESKQADEKDKEGIIYMGSHNMTKAAWGKIEKKQTQLYIANSELGLVFPNMKINAFKKWSPFKYPPEKYKQGDAPFLR